MLIAPLSMGTLMTFQAVAHSTNRISLVIGEITSAEAELASRENPIIDGKGLYLISVDGEANCNLGNVLAKFVSEDAAQELARFFRLSGRLEAAA
jgi:hypothetical protein